MSEERFDLDRLAKALVDCGMLVHGPKPPLRSGRTDPGPPWESVSPYSWAMAIRDAYERGKPVATRLRG